MDAVVITGVSTGIGLSASEILCEAGYKVFGSVRKIEDAEGLSSKYPNFKPLIFDVRNEEAIQEGANYVKEQLSEAHPSLWSCYKELVPLLLRQHKAVTKVTT